ncbi:hypothetical protein DBR32_11220 [Taibaiella sp. KBW10]|uniref:hypothetical protein n=1 Tax=Taibaiella sp. KBW10 TaxID=2153357 RepID=UPI000F5A3140|nr:hypothetical protein [Taibaiella sp. KBW10]RQO30148.1 hypothetical protein DBR32_11220 [Taibaiella sp. KBW10]
MNKKAPQIFRKSTLNIKRLFLMDGLGALLTAFLLFVILRPFEAHFGMPQATLTMLSLIALAFCIYGITCFFFVKNNWRPFLQVISIANLLYVCVTLGLVLYYDARLTVLGFMYFLLEMILILGLAFFELYVSRARHHDDRSLP